MHPDQTGANSRVFFFDNLRYFLVLIVVFFHCLAGYSGLINGWIVDDDNFALADSLIILFDVFLMPGLFFIAGYFALFSHQGQTTWAFIKKKLFHLGIPWLIGIIFLNPAVMYIKKFSRDQPDLDFWQFFVFKIKSALCFYTGLFDLSKLGDQFHQFHLWFVSLLLFFFIVFALMRKLKSIIFSKTSTSKPIKPASGISIVAVIFSIAFLEFILNCFVHGMFPGAVGPTMWLIIGNVLQFQASRIIIYSFCFCLGIYAYHKKWFSNNKAPGNLIVWGVLTVISGAVLHETLFSIIEGFTPAKGILYLLMHSMFFFSMLLFLVGAGTKFWNSSSKTNRLLADNSYNVYLIHFIFVFLFQLMLLNITMIPVYLKPFIVFILSVSASLLISHYLIKKSRSLSVAGIVGIFALLSIILRNAPN